MMTAAVRAMILLSYLSSIQGDVLGSLKHDEIDAIPDGYANDYEDEEEGDGAFGNKFGFIVVRVHVNIFLQECDSKAIWRWAA